nr:hypothetical protein CFP56_76241 [Quercus suber]
MVMSKDFSFLRAWKSIHCRAWKPLVFPRQTTVSIPADAKIEEETIPDYDASRYYPVRNGHTFRDRYQVVGNWGLASPRPCG